MSEKEKLNMALDDVIKLSKRGGNRNRGGQMRGGSRGRRGQRRGGNRFFRGGNRGQQRGNLSQQGPKGNFRRRKFLRPKPSFKKEGGRINQKFIKKTGKKNAGQRKMSGGEAAGQAQNKKTILRISGLHLNIVNTELYDLFSQFGPMKKCRIDYDQLGRSYGTAIVQYEKHEHAEKAISEYNGAELDGHKLHVEYLDKRGGDIQVPQIKRRGAFKQKGNFNRRIRK